jgi:predicted HicB family RNase H-like nuclease
MSKKIGRPTIKNKKEQLNLTVNKELNVALTEFAEENGLSKSEYIEYLIKKDIKKKN